MINIIFVCMFSILLLMCSALPTSHGNTMQDEIDDLQMTIRPFAGKWLKDNGQESLSPFVSEHSLTNTCLMGQDKDHQKLHKSARQIILDYLSDTRKLVNKGGNPSEVFEPLPVVNPDIKTDMRLGWGTLFKVNAHEAGALLCSETEAAELMKAHKQSNLYVLAFKVKGIAEGEIPPFILIWKKEETGWRIIDVGVVKM